VLARERSSDRPSRPSNTSTATAANPANRPTWTAAPLSPVASARSCATQVVRIVSVGWLRSRTNLDDQKLRAAHEPTALPIAASHAAI